MRKFKKNYELELMILRTFLKHVKEYHLYHRFRCSVGLKNRRKDLFHIIASRTLTNYNAICKLGEMGSYYMNAESLEDILETMLRKLERLHLMRFVKTYLAISLRIRQKK